MNHKIRIAISRVDTPEPGTGTFTNAQLEGGEFQFTSKDQVKQYLEDARKTMNEDQIKVLLTALGCESVDDAMTMVANMSDEEVAKFGAWMKTADQSSTDVNMPMYNVDNMKKQNIQLTNTEAEKVKNQVEQYIDQQLDKIKTQDGASLRDWVHQEGGIQKVLTSAEFKVKQLGYKLLTSVEQFVKSLNPQEAEAFVQENGTNIRDWFNKALKVSASAKPSRCTKLIAHVEKIEATASFTMKAADEARRIMEVLEKPEVKAQVMHLLGPNGVYLLRNFIGFDGNIRNEGSEAVLSEACFDALVELSSRLKPYVAMNNQYPGLDNCFNVIDQFELFVENDLKGDASQLDELTLREGADDTAWETFLEQHDIDGLLNEDEVGNFNLRDLNEVFEVEWESVLGIYGDPEALNDPELALMAERLGMRIGEVIETAQKLKNLNEMWDQFQDSWEGPYGDLKGELEPLDDQWRQARQDQVMKELAQVLETVGIEQLPADRQYAQQ